MVAGHPSVDAVVYLGLGIQSNQARLMRQGRFYPDYGIERIVAYHERQDARFAQVAAEVSEATGKPILTATELAVADPANPGPQGSAPPAGSAAAPTGRHRAWAPLPLRPLAAPTRAVATAAGRGNGGRGRPASSSRCSWSASPWCRPSGCGGGVVGRRRGGQGEPTAGGRPLHRGRLLPILSAQRIPGIVTGQLDDGVPPGGRHGRRWCRPGPRLPAGHARRHAALRAAQRRAGDPCVEPEAGHRRRSPRGPGPGPALATVVVAPEVSGGVVTGDLTLVGGGDAARHAALPRLAGQGRQGGPRRTRPSRRSPTPSWPRVSPASLVPW